MDKLKDPALILAAADLGLLAFSYYRISGFYDALDEKVKKLTERIDALEKAQNGVSSETRKLTSNINNALKDISEDINHINSSLAVVKTQGSKTKNELADTQDTFVDFVSNLEKVSIVEENKKFPVIPKFRKPQRNRRQIERTDDEDERTRDDDEDYDNNRKRNTNVNRNRASSSNNNGRNRGGNSNNNNNNKSNRRDADDDDEIERQLQGMRE